MFQLIPLLYHKCGRNWKSRQIFGKPGNSKQFQHKVGNYPKMLDTLVCLLLGIIFPGLQLNNHWEPWGHPSIDSRLNPFKGPLLIKYLWSPHPFHVAHYRMPNKHSRHSVGYWLVPNSLTLISIFFFFLISRHLKLK